MRKASENALVRIEKASSLSQYITATTKTAQLMQESLTPYPEWHDECKETPEAKTKTVLSGGVVCNSNHALVLLLNECGIIGNVFTSTSFDNK